MEGYGFSYSFGFNKGDSEIFLGLVCFGTSDMTMIYDPYRKPFHVQQNKRSLTHYFVTLKIFMKNLILTCQLLDMEEI